MNKQEFLASLKSSLSGLPQQEIEDRISFYSEMIDDKVEDGCPEEKVIAEIGPVDRIASQIITEIPLSTLAKARMSNKRRLTAGEITLLVLGSPIWITLLVAAVAVTASIYASLWAIVISLWAVFASMIACSLAGLLVGFTLAISINGHAGIALFSAGLVCGGLGIFLFYGCLAASKGLVSLTKIMILGIKKCLIKKEDSLNA